MGTKLESSRYDLEKKIWTQNLLISLYLVLKKIL